MRKIKAVPTTPQLKVLSRATAYDFIAYSLNNSRGCQSYIWGEEREKRHIKQENTR